MSHPSRCRPPPAVPAVVRGAPRRTLGGGAGASSSAAAVAVSADARAAAGLAGRSCLCARHLRRRHLGGGLRGACGKAWRRAPRGAGSGSAHCGGAERDELGPEAGSVQDAVSDARGGRGQGLGTRGAEGPGVLWGGSPGPAAASHSGKPPSLEDKGCGSPAVAASIAPGGQGAASQGVSPTAVLELIPRGRDGCG